MCPFEETKEEKAEKTEYEIEDQLEEEGIVINFIKRSGDEIRRKYLMTLTQQKIWLTPQEKPATN